MIGNVECVLKSNSTFLEGSLERTDEATRLVLLMVINLEMSDGFQQPEAAPPPLLAHMARKESKNCLARPKSLAADKYSRASSVLAVIV